MAFHSDVTAIALALHRSCQGRLVHTASHFPVFFFVVRWRNLHRLIDRNRRTGVAVLAAPVPPGMVSQVQLHLGWRTRWRRSCHNLHTLLCRLWRIGRLSTVPCLGGKSCQRKRRLLQRERCSKMRRWATHL